MNLRSGTEAENAPKRVGVIQPALVDLYQLANSFGGTEGNK